MRRKFDFPTILDNKKNIHWQGIKNTYIETGSVLA